MQWLYSTLLNMKCNWIHRNLLGKEVLSFNLFMHSRCYIVQMQRKIDPIRSDSICFIFNFASTRIFMRYFAVLHISLLCKLKNLRYILWNHAFQKMWMWIHFCQASFAIPKMGTEKLLSYDFEMFNVRTHSPNYLD